MNAHKRPRTLRTFRIWLAFKDHKCDMCGRVINSGETYDGFVMVCSTRLFVRKYHVICPFEFFDEEEEMMREYDRKEKIVPFSRIQFQERKPLRRAA